MSAMTGINVHTVPMFEDNYSYIVLDAKRELAAVVDPADASKFVPRSRAERHGMQPPTCALRPAGWHRSCDVWHRMHAWLIC